MPHPQLHPTVAQALDARGYQELTPVQSAVIAPEAEGRDLIVSAKTGSGKTVAFGLAITSALVDGDSAPVARAPLALVITPTRELAIQVSKELEWLYANARARVVTCVGGMDPMKERRALSAGAHVVVGTPDVGGEVGRGRAEQIQLHGQVPVGLGSGARAADCQVQG